MVFLEFLQKFLKIIPQIPRNVFKITYIVFPLIYSFNFVKFLWKLHEISTKMWRKLIQEVISWFFETPS